MQRRRALSTFILTCSFTVIDTMLMTSPGFAQMSSIRNKDLEISVNKHLQTKITNLHPGCRPLMTAFSFSEYLETKYYKAEDFIFRKKETLFLRDKAGQGVVRRYYGNSSRYGLEKILSVKTYTQFPNSAYVKVAYVNHGRQPVEIKKWVNHHYEVIPPAGHAAFWSFQGSSHQDRRDWITQVDTGFYARNFMGMNDSDYGGGIPVTDLWRKDAGIAIGHTATVAKLVCLPVDYDISGKGAAIGIEYSFPVPTRLAPGDTLFTLETFVSVHQKDCFGPLRAYGQYMATKGIKGAAAEPGAFEPVWCAWGYEKDFTIEEILNTLPKVKALGIKWVGLDDGFQQAEGDWHTNKKHFPGGDAQMKAFVDSIHAQGLKAMIWWTPLAVKPGSKLLAANPNILLKQKNGAPQFITWWNAYYMAPTDSAVIATTRETVRLFLEDWGFDALKLDGQHMNACAPDYAAGHHIGRPEQSFEQLPMLFREIYEMARSIKPGAVVEFCPCGDCVNFYTMPYTNQFVASDPLSSWQVRSKGKVYKALMPQTAYFGDHVELTDDHVDFPSQIGIGAVPGTKFVWPATGIKSKDENLLTPEKEQLFKKYLRIYREKMLSQGIYRGDLYDIGYDEPETHCIQKSDTMYYAFYHPGYNGYVELRGLDAGRSYEVSDYVNQTVLGTVSGAKPLLEVSFKQSLLLEVKQLP